MKASLGAAQAEALALAQLDEDGLAALGGNRLFLGTHVWKALKNHDEVLQRIRYTERGVVTTDIKDSMDASGPIGLQHHGEKGQTYKFRNARIKAL